MKCVTGARYTMLATLMIQASLDLTDGDPGDDDTDNSIVQTQVRDGVTYVLEIRQDPDSGSIERQWVVATNPSGTEALPDLTPNTTDDQVSFPCSVKGFVDGGLRVVGTTERWSSRGHIEHVDSVTMKFPPFVNLSARDRVTNIRDKRSGKTIWTEDDGTPTVFEVTGTVPITDMFGKVIEYSTLLNRAEVQGHR